MTHSGYCHPRGDGNEVGVSFNRSSLSSDFSLFYYVLKDGKLFEKLLLVSSPEPKAHW